MRKNVEIPQEVAGGKETALAAIQVQPGYTRGVSGREVKTKPENKGKTKQKKQAPNSIGTGNKAAPLRPP